MLEIYSLWIKYVVFIIGMLVAAFGGSCTIWTKILIEPHSGMVLELKKIINYKFKKVSFSSIRISLDFLFIILAIIIGYATKQRVFGFNPETFNIEFPLISYSTIFFIMFNGIVFGLSLKFLKKTLRKCTR